MRRIVRRLLSVDSRELRDRAAERAATAVEALRATAGLERWNPRRLCSIWAGPSGIVPRANDPAWGDRNAIDRRLRIYFLDRPARFVLDPGDRERMALLISSRLPTAATHAAARADALVAGSYDLLGYTALSFNHDSPQPDWHFDPVHRRGMPRRFWSRVPYLDPRYGDHKIIWELNRHQHWLALGRATWLTGEPRYAQRVAGELRSWLDANPPLTGVNWASMLELGFRCISWVWALHFLAPFAELDDERWAPELLVALHRQLEHISRHLSVYFSPNTHLLGEALALYVAGRVLPELRGSDRWERRGRQILIAESRRQVLPDGGHAERSAHYHRYALDFYLLALCVARRTGDEALPVFEEVASRMAAYASAIADGQGRLPLIGDDDGGLLLPICGREPADVRDSLWLAASLLDRPEWAIGDLPEEAMWMLGQAPELRRPSGQVSGSQYFPDTGYAVLRSADTHAVLDVGGHGYLNGGHAHADALSVVLSTQGHPLVVDPGTATYTMDPEVRDRFRSTAMHNSVVVDGRPQSVPSGPFHWKTRTDAEVMIWSRQERAGRPFSTPPFDYVEAQHDAYAPIVHRRAILRADDLWLIVDHVLGTGRHRIEAYFHLDPAWTAEGSRLGALRHPSGIRAAMASASAATRLVIGDPRGLGWCAPIYGNVVPAPTIRFLEERECPWSLVTAIGPSATHLGLSVVPVSVDAPDGWHRVAVLGKIDGRVFVALFATPLDAAPASPRRLQRVRVPAGEMVTDARVGLARMETGAGHGDLALLEARTASWTGRARAAFGPATAAANLHLPLCVADSSATMAARA